MKTAVLKRIGLVFLCGMLLLCPLLFVGCNSSSTLNEYEEQGFTAIYSITYTINNSNTTTLYSEYTISYETEEVTEEVFNSSNASNIYTVYFLTTTTGYISLDGTIGYSVGYQYKYEDSDSYYIATITEITKNYLYVKILDDNKFELINTSGSHYLINTSYYRIQYFV